MEAAKGTLKTILNIMMIVIVLMGIVSSVLFLITHIKLMPINFSYSSEFVLVLLMFITYLISNRFNFKFCKRIAAVALIISIFNLVGFRILIKLFARG